MAKNRVNPISNQVFIGCPWKTIRKKYITVTKKLNNKYPLSFIFIGRDDGQEAEDLLSIIKLRLFSSSYAIFDATGGNANVSLEYGLADAAGLDKAIYLCIHRASNKNSSQDNPIIADLAGRKRNHYTQESALKTLLNDFCKQHPFTQRFEQFLKKHSARKPKGIKKRIRSLALKILHFLDGKEKSRRSDIINYLQAAQYTAQEIDNTVTAMLRAELLRSERGPGAAIIVN